MKKIITLILCILLLSGCGKSKEEKLISEFKSDVNSSKSYLLEGSLELYNGDDTYTYTVKVGYKKKDMYKVNLTNQVNNHEQIILKNTEGVYVITPSLNKSFKFQSEWPNNSSQSYILESILNDLTTTEDKSYEETDDYYIVKSNVSYPNNPNLTYQKIYFDKNMNLKKNEVYDKDNILKIKVSVNNIDYKANLEDDYFDLDASINEDCCNTNETAEFKDILYPLYIPTDTYLTTKETVNTDAGTRAILTFSGSKDFVLVEEASNPKTEFETIPVYGDPIMMNGSVGALSGNSLYWSANNVDYYLAGSNMSEEELLSVANSISNTIVTGK